MLAMKIDCQQRQQGINSKQKNNRWKEEVAVMINSTQGYKSKILIIKLHSIGYTPNWGERKIERLDGME
jgi:hypothetical protein